jgi:hypothetical protein
MRWWPRHAPCEQETAPVPDAGLEEADAAVERAASAAEAARVSLAAQRQKREEDQDLMLRLDKLAGRDSNHLGRLVLNAFTENRRRNG